MGNMVYGTVKKITEVTKNGRTYYGVVLVENDQLYRTGGERANCRDGDKVEFEENPGKFGVFVKDNTLRVTGSAGSSQQATTSGGGGGGYSNSKSDYANKELYWQEKEQRDIENSKRYAYRASWAASRQFVELALANGALKLGAANAKAPDKWEILREAIDKRAAELYTQFQNEAFDIEAYAEETAVDGVPAKEASGGDPWKE